MSIATKAQALTWSFSLVISPVLVAVAHIIAFFEGISATAGWIGVIGYTIWMLGFMGLYQLLSSKTPWFSIVGFAVSVYACVACTNFMTETVLMDAIGVSEYPERAKIRDANVIPAIFTFYLPVALFPVSLIMLGINLSVHNILSLRVAMLLIVGAVAFSISRIPRIIWLIHLDNLLMIVANILVVKEVFPIWRKQFSRKIPIAPIGDQLMEEMHHSPRS